MAFETIIALGFGGLVLVGLAVQYLRARFAPPLTEKAVSRAWRAAFPADKISQVDIAATGRAALVETDKGLGILWRLGTGMMTRRLPCRSIDDHASGLRLRFADLTAPVVLLRLDPEEKVRWRAKMDS